MSSFEIKLTSLSDWIVDAASAAKESVALEIASEHLLSTIGDLADVNGAVGGIFKLASRVIPNPTAEQRIATLLHRTLALSLDKELKRAKELVPVLAWRRYATGRLREVAASRLRVQFTWLSIFGRAGQRPGRSWPIVSDLADLGRHWILESVTLDRRPTVEIQQFADDARGRIYDSLSEAMDKLVSDPRIAMAVAEARRRVSRDVLLLLAAELTGLQRYRLFGEISQESIYIPPRLRIVDSNDVREASNWKTGRIVEGGDEILFQTIRHQHPRIMVIEGEMGSGKSCLMRALGSRLANAFRHDRTLAPVYVRWRDIFDKPDLPRAIADQLSWEYGLSFADLPKTEGVVFLIDGFDEMNSHQEGYVSACFDTIAQIVRNKCSVVVAMRSTVITAGLRQLWKNRSVLSVEVQSFDNNAIDTWAQKWVAETGAHSVTGDRLRSLCRYGGEKEIAQNPLLLYMLAKYVEPRFGEAKQQDVAPMTRTQIFRMFVDETIRGKVRNSAEDFPIPVSDSYRLLLQEIARVASWPDFSPRCPARIMRDMTREADILQDLNFSDIRTAFVLHFFEPCDLSANEFEFQPEGFRQYLLAEWCVRTQIEALKDDRHAETHLSRTRKSAVNSLAQFPLMGEERSLLNEIFEEIGRLSLSSKGMMADRLRAFGVKQEKGEGLGEIVEELYERLVAEVQSPPFENWDDERVGVPVGQKIPDGFKSVRFMLNYWDQCLIGFMGLYRGLNRSLKEDEPFRRDPAALARFIRLTQAIRGFSWRSDLNLGGILLPRVDLRGMILSEANMNGCSLAEANLERSIIRNADLRNSRLEKANLVGVDLSGSNLVDARLTGADLTHALVQEALLLRVQARNAVFSYADLQGSELTDGQFDGSIMDHVDLGGCLMDRCHFVDVRATNAVMAGSQMNSARLKAADFSGATFVRSSLRLADFSSAILKDAVLDEAMLVRANLASVKGQSASLRGADLSMADMRNSDFQGADLRKSNLSGASLAGARLGGALLDGAIYVDEQLKMARFD